MKVVMLMGSMKLKGNTAKVTSMVTDQLVAMGAEVETYNLVEKNIRPCMGCASCQNVLDDYGCVIEDDVVGICDAIMSADAILLSSPIYSWYSTTPVKSLLDRLVYMMNKYYGSVRGGSTWSGKKMGLITTCGYPDHYGADLFVTGMKRYTKHSELNYIGHFNARDKGKGHPFMTPELQENIVNFAKETFDAIQLQGQCE